MGLAMLLVEVRTAEEWLITIFKFFIWEGIIVRYTVEHQILWHRWLVFVKLNYFRQCIRRYTSPNENFEYSYHLQNAVLLWTPPIRIHTSSDEEPYFSLSPALISNFVCTYSEDNWICGMLRFICTFTDLLGLRIKISWVACFVWFFTSHQQSFSYKGMGLLGLTQY